MNQQVVVTDPASGHKYPMVYDTEDPSVVTIGDGDNVIEIPIAVLSMMVRSWELEIIDDHFEHRPVKGYTGE